MQSYKQSSAKQVQKLYGFLNAGATSLGQGLLETGKQLASMIIQYGIMNKLGGKNFLVVHQVVVILDLKQKHQKHQR